MNKKLFLKYIEFFGDKPPYPPKHIMETLVKMKEDGSFDTKIKIFDGITGQKVRKNLENISGEKLSLDHPIFKIDFKNMKE